MPPAGTTEPIEVLTLVREWAVGSETKPAAADLPFLGPRRAQEGRRGLLSWAWGWGLSPFSMGK